MQKSTEFKLRLASIKVLEAQWRSKKTAEAAQVPSLQPDIDTKGEYSKSLKYFRKKSNRL